MPKLTPIFLAALVLTVASAAFAGTLNVSTGLDSSYNLITTDGGFDAHWLVQQQNSTYTPAQVVMPGDADWYGGWIPNGPNSNWIGRDAFNCCNGPAPYTFDTTFSVSDPSVASISGLWTIDDAGVLALNGQTLDSQGGGNWGSLHPFSASGSAWFVTGVNTLAITITSDDNYLEGVRLEGTVIGVSTTPEPSSLLLLGSGVLGVFGIVRRKLVG
jgi:hypothetical protein